MKASCTLLFAASCLVMLGCGGGGRPGLIPASGKVTLNGEPIEGADVMLLPIGDDSSGYSRPSHAVTNDQGEFSIGTYGEADGLPTGKYALGVAKRDLIGELPEDYDPENPGKHRLRYKLIVPRQYEEPKSSGLEIEVTSEGIKPDTIELTSEGNPEVITMGQQGEDV